MCGGRGTRLESDREKPLHPIAGTPMVDRVLAGLEASRLDTIFAVVSPNAPQTAEQLDRTDAVRTIETEGEGYVTDLLSALEDPAVEPPVLSVAADLPLLEGAVIDRMLEVYDRRRERLQRAEHALVVLREFAQTCEGQVCVVGGWVSGWVGG